MITYWKKQNSGFVDSVDESTLAKHPEKVVKKVSKKKK